MSSSEIFICFSCGAKNRVPTGRLSSARCGKCKKTLIEAPVDASPQSSVHPSQSPKKATTSTAKISSIPWKIIFIVAALCGAGYFFTSGQTSRPNKPSTYASLPPVVYQSPGVMWNYTGMMGVATLRIITSPGADYYIKLVDYYSGADRVGIFVNGGQRLDVRVPPGSYKLRYAYGKSWRGQYALFGPGRNTNYQQSPTRFDFSTTNGYTIELIKQAGGNMPTSSIGSNQF